MTLWEDFFFVREIWEMLYCLLKFSVFDWGILTVCHLLEQERQQHNQLKHTWQKANDQFLESQRLLMRDMQRMEIVLTSEQLRQVEELKKKDQVNSIFLGIGFLFKLCTLTHPQICDCVTLCILEVD